VNAFGWLAGKEALAGGASNLGLYDREYHFGDQESSWAMTLNYFNLNADDLGIRQKNSSWHGSGPIFPSLAVIRKELLCEFFLSGPPSSP